MALQLARLSWSRLHFRPYPSCRGAQHARFADVSQERRFLFCVRDWGVTRPATKLLAATSDSLGSRAGGTLLNSSGHGRRFASTAWPVSRRLFCPLVSFQASTVRSPRSSKILRGMADQDVFSTRNENLVISFTSVLLYSYFIPHNTKRNTKPQNLRSEY